MNKSPGTSGIEAGDGDGSLCVDNLDVLVGRWSSVRMDLLLPLGGGCEFDDADVQLVAEDELRPGLDQSHGIVDGANVASAIFRHDRGDDQSAAN